MALFNFPSITEALEGFPQASGGGGSSSVASAGAVAGSIIPGVGTAIGTLVGGVLGSIFPNISKTPRLPWSEQNKIATPISASIREFVKPYISVGRFVQIFNDRTVSFINSSNPGQAHERGGFLKSVASDNNTNSISIWPALMYSLSGVSTGANDITGVEWRVAEVLNRVVIPTIRQYETEKGIKQSILDPVSPGGAVPIIGGGGSGPGTGSGVTGAGSTEAGAVGAAGAASTIIPGIPDLAVYGGGFGILLLVIVLLIRK